MNEFKFYMSGTHLVLFCSVVNTDLNSATFGLNSAFFCKKNIITCRGGVDLRCGHFLVKMYAKTKELHPIGGRAPGTPPQIRQ